MTDHRQPRRAAISKRHRALRLAAALALAASAASALGAACAACAACSHAGDNPSPPARAGSLLPDACSLLTGDDVQAVTREVSGSLSSTLEDAIGRDTTQCSYSLAGTPPRVISLSLRRYPSAVQAADQQQAAESGLRSIAAGAPAEELPHLGDGAFWVGGQIDQLNVRRGDSLLIFTVQIDRDPLRAARTLAGKALGRLAHPALAITPAPAPGPAPQGRAPAASALPQGGGS